MQPTALFTAETIAAFREIGRGPFKDLPGCEALHIHLPVEDPRERYTYEPETADGELHILCVCEGSKPIGFRAASARESRCFP